MSLLSNYSDVLDDLGNLRYIGSAAPRYLAEALVFKQLRHMHGLPIPAREGTSQLFLELVCHQLGTTPGGIESLDLSLSVVLRSSYGRELEKTAFPSERFIGSTRDYLLSQPSLVELMAHAQRAACTWRYNRWIRNTLLVAVGTYEIVSGAITGFSWWQNAAVSLFTASAALIIPGWAKEDMRDAEADLIRAASKHVLQQWTRASMEYGSWTISVAKRWHEHDTPDPAEQAKAGSRIDDAAGASPEIIHNFIARTSLATLPNVRRGFCIEVNSPNPDLAGTHLLISAFPKWSPNDSDSGNNRRSRKAIYDTRWDCLAAPTPQY